MFRSTNAIDRKYCVAMKDVLFLSEKLDVYRFGDLCRPGLLIFKLRHRAKLIAHAWAFRLGMAQRKPGKGSGGEVKDGGSVLINQMNSGQFADVAPK